MKEIYDLVIPSFNNMGELEHPLVVSSILGKNKGQGIYKLRTLDGEELDSIFLDEDLVKFKLDADEDIIRRANFNYADISKNLEEYKHTIEPLKNLANEIIEDSLHESLTDINSSNYFDSHTTFKKIENLSLSEKSIFIEDMKDYIDIELFKNIAQDINELLNNSMKNYLKCVFKLNNKLILKKYLLLHIDTLISSLKEYDLYCILENRFKDARCSSYFIIKISPEDIIASIDEFLLDFNKDVISEYSIFYKVRTSFFEFLKSKFNI